MASLCCGGPQIPLDAPRQKLMRGLQITCTIEFCLAVLAMVGSRYFDGALMVLAAVIFLFMVKDTTKASTAIMCMFIFHVMQTVFSTVYFILYLVGVPVYAIPKQLWRKRCLEASIYGLFGVFLVSAVLSYLVFDYMRKILWGGQGQGDDIDTLNRPAPPEESHGRRGFGYDVENQASPKKPKAEKPKDDWKKTAGGQSLGGSKNAENPWKK